MFRNRKIIITLFILVVFILSSTSQTNLNSPANENPILKPSISNTLFNGKSYPFELKDVYDDENYTKIYTDAYLQTEYFNDTTLDWNGTVFEDQVSVVNNTEYVSPDPSDITMVNGTYDNSDNMRELDSSYSDFDSTEYDLGTDLYVDDITYVTGSHTSGIYSDMNSRDGNTYDANSVYQTYVHQIKMRLYFDPDLAGQNYNFYIKLSTTITLTELKIGTSEGSNNLFGYNAISSLEINGDLKTGISQIWVLVYGSTSFQLNVDEFRLIQEGTGTPAKVFYG